MTADEIKTLTAERERLGMLWAGPSLIDAELRKEGLTGETLYLDSPVSYNLPVVKAMFPLDEAAALATYLKSPEGAGVNWLLEGLENPDINHPTFGQLLGYLATVAQVISMTTVLSILDLGKRVKTRSEELFGRQLTIAEITEGINAWEVANA